MNSTYKTNGCNEKFMSSNTFRKWFFSWASHQNIDFRKQCSWCGESPPILACDATKIGIAMKNCSIEPIETFTSPEVMVNNHKINDRCFLRYPNSDENRSISSKDLKDMNRNIREAREHLKFVTKPRMGQEVMEPELLRSKNDNLLRNCPEKCKRILQRMLLQQNVTTLQITLLRKFFYLLSFESPLRCLVPFDIHDHLHSVLEMFKGNVAYDAEYIDAFTKVNVEIGSLIRGFQIGPSLDPDIMMLLTYLLVECISIHKDDPNPSISDPQAGSYNPPVLGRAYYFRKNGMKVRDVRKFSIDGANQEQNRNSSCSKYYPKVSMPGSTFLSLWFCPLHGHCYGMHIVNKSEGRKDPSHSLYSHLQTPPEAIFYDFACGLEEYSLNREAGYFRKTRFFHDIFHGYGHNCSPLYSSARTNAYDGVNLSICEQFNSYLQCIKASAKHMSQENFMFYVQFMINLWNEKKRISYEKKLKVAAGIKVI